MVISIWVVNCLHVNIYLKVKPKVNISAAVVVVVTERELGWFLMEMNKELEKVPVTTPEMSEEQKKMQEEMTKKRKESIENQQKNQPE